MFAIGNLAQLRQRHEKSPNSDSLATPRTGRTRRQPRLEILEARLLLYGNPAITEFPIPTSFAQPQGITVGPDGNLWFTESDLNEIGRITPSGQVTQFSAGISPYAFPAGITLGPDGNLWFTEPNLDQIGRITTAGQVSEFSDGITPGSHPTGITAGPDGSLWFTEYDGGIGTMNTAGQGLDFTTGITPGSHPTAITVGPDGNLWFTEAAGRIGKVNGLQATEFSNGISSDSQPEGITAGPDGNLWFTEIGGEIGRITTTGHVTQFSTGITPGSEPYDITAGPYGNLWFTNNGGGIGRINTSGVVTEYSGTTTGSQPRGITAGPDGNFWFTEYNAGQIGRLDPPLTATGTTISASKGVPFSGLVGTFTDLAPNRSPSDYLATINWGDATAATPGQVTEDASGTFYVTGSHTYARSGSDYSVSVTIINDPGGTETTADSTATVVPMPLLLSADSLAAIEGVPVPADTVVASFVNTGGADPLADYTATIDWGDGSAVAPAGVVASGADFLVVTPTGHTYAKDGTYSFTVNIGDVEGGLFSIGETAYATGLAVVADAPLVGVSVPALPSKPRGTPLAGVTVASFQDTNPAAPLTDFTATIDWGDGSPNTIGTIAQPGGIGTAFVVTGNHTYLQAQAAPYIVTVAIHDNGGASLVTTTTTTVTEVPPIVTGIPVKMTKGLPFSAPVAYIVENPGLPPDPAGNYTATIDWGDGTKPTLGTVAAVPGGDWVVGSHAYAQSGPYTITITVKEGAFTVVATAEAFDPPAVPRGPSRHFHRGSAHSGHRTHASLTNGTAKPHRVGEPLENPRLQAAHLRKLVP